MDLSYWTAVNEYRNFMYHSHLGPETYLFPELTDKEQTGEARFSLAYGIWDYIDMAASATYYGTFYERGMYEERSTGHWEEIYGLNAIELLLHGGYNPIPNLEDVVWFGGDFRLGLAPADTVFLRNEDGPDGLWYTGQLMSTVRRPFTTTGNNSLGMDLLITGDFTRWLPMAPTQAHINIGYAKYKQNYHFTDFRALPDSTGWAYSDSTAVDVGVDDGVLDLGFGLEVSTPYVDVFLEYTNQKLLDREHASVSYFTPGIRLKNNSGTFFDVSFDLSTSTFDPGYYDLGHGLYQADSVVTEADRAERAPLPIGGVFDWGISIGLGYSSAIVTDEGPAPTAFLSGTVTDALTGQAVFATITCPGMPIANVTSDGVTGAYANSVPPGEVPVTVVAPGYSSASARVVLRLDETVTQDFALLPNLGSVSGFIMDSEGSPIVGASVTIGSTTPVTVTSDGSGSFRTDVEAGTWEISVQADGYIPDSRSLSVNAAETSSASFNLRDALRAGAVLSFDNIYFDSGSATLKPESFGVLDGVVSLLRENATVRVQIAGHTDSDGSESSNQTLSENRAQSVYQYLVSAGISSSRLTTIGYGEGVPVVPNTSAANKARNRRIEFTVLSV
jgi:outer membrane protein OmpA-like peptidoglycan-associated protein